MPKVLLVILVIMLTAQLGVQGQTPAIKVEQYTILTERVVYRNFNNCQKYVHVSLAPPGSSNCTTGNPSCCPPGTENTPQCTCQSNLGYKNYCAVEDTTCGNGCYPERLFFYMHKGSTITPIASEINLSNFAKGQTQIYYDTIHVYQPQLDITRIRTQMSESLVKPYYWYYSSIGFDIFCYFYNPENFIELRGELFDTTFHTSAVKYSVDTRVRVVPNMEPSFTLPSHDKIRISQSASLGYTPVWQYQDTLSALTNTWHDISPSLTTNGGNLLNISGYDLFGNNYVSLLHSTVKFRVRNPAGTVFSNITAFTLRLSSPHMTSVVPTHLNCFEKNEGTVKIQFDRALLTGERLNILLFDTVNRVSYSALSLSELAGDNSYTWPSELRAGKYLLTLLGKYAKGIEYDLNVNLRVDTVTAYTALNSVNFEDGFDTDNDEDFHAYTDFTGYAQATYTGALSHMTFVQLNQPPKIRFMARVDSVVQCKGTASGVISLAAEGGKFNYKYSLKHADSTNWTPWVNFDNNNKGIVYWPTPFFYSDLGVTTKVRNLYAGKYLLRVRDMVDCYPKDSAGNEITFSFTITEPEKGITIDLLEISPITAPDSANGRVKVHLSGGTPFINGEVFHWPYTIEWIDSTTNQAVAFTNTILEANKRMETKTGLLADGVYYLRVYDAWHAVAAPNNAGCFLEMKIPVRKPQPLLVNIQNPKQVTCYDSANAELLAKVSGGIPIDSLRYTFKWYRVTSEGNNLLPVTDSVLTNLGPGNYQVEVTDKYDNKKLSQIFTLTQPARLQLQMTSTQASCYSTNDGSLGVQVTGGTPYSFGYRYEWSTGHRTPAVSNVAGGNYLVVVTDSMYCTAIDTVSVTSPLRVIPEVTVNPVKCRGACDGQISVSATGGSGVYTWLWSNGATTSSISNLCAGTYWFRVTDLSGCSESDTITLDEPDTLFVNLGADRKICIGQTIRLNATASDTAVLTYAWTGSNGFTASTAKVNITQPGTYQVAVSNIRGCVVRDTIIVTAENSTINTDFVVSTQAFVNEPVSLVNISQPRTDSVRWIVPNLGNVIRVVSQNNDRCELIFSDTGRYAITMRAYYASGCIEDSTKIVNVIPQSGPVTGGNPGNAFLKAYAVIYPNPSTGTFKVNLTFSEVTKARLRLINTLTNIIVDDRLVQGDDEYTLDYYMGSLTNGVYILLIEAAKGSFVYKVVIVH